jgi:hypothetical protein
MAVVFGSAESRCRLVQGASLYRSNEGRDSSSARIALKSSVRVN